MTLWAFLSDIHGNLRMLDTALEHARQLGVERYAFLGDYLGRGNPDGVMDRVRELQSIAIVGNRDLDWASRVSHRTRDHVLSLPRRCAAERFLVAHGDPKLDRELNVNDLKRGAPRIYRVLRSEQRALFLFGHTHHARTWVKRTETADPELVAAPRLELAAVPDGAIVIINVGTVGKPFPGKGPASFTLLDDATDGYVEHQLIEAHR